MKNRNLDHLLIKFILVTISFIAIYSILTACTKIFSNNTAAPTSFLSPPRSNLPITTFTGAQELLPTGTFEPITSKTPTITPSAIPTSTPSETEATSSFSFHRQCIEVLNGHPQTSLPGVLVLDNSRTGIYFLNMTDYTRHTFPITPGGFLPSLRSAVSPDGKWLAYLESFVDEHGNWNSLKLRLINADGLRKILPYWIPDWQAINAWLDNEHLILSLPDRPPGAVIVLNVFSGQWYEFSPILPNIKISDYFYLYPTVFYDPTLSFAVYSGFNIEYLADIETQKVLWHKDVDEFSPAWSPIGKQFLVSVNHRLLLINTTGSETLILDLVNTDIPFTDWSDIGNMSWSPDGSKIAVWLGNPPRLGIIDMITKKIKDLCITGVYYPSSSLIWSTDGQYIAITEKSDNWGFSSDFVIVSLFEGYAYRIAEDVTPIGWLINP